MVVALIARLISSKDLVVVIMHLQVIIILADYDVIKLENDRYIGPSS